MTIDGVKCDRGIIDACETAVKAKGDGRVSKEDAEKVFAKAAEGFKVTRCARWTLRWRTMCTLDVAVLLGAFQMD